MNFSPKHLAILSYAFIFLLTSGLAWIVTRNIGGLDDAYITYVFARNLAEGHGISWIAGGTPVYGSTTLVYTALLGGFNFFGLESPFISLVVGATCWALSLVVVGALFRRELGLRSMVFSLLLAALSVTMARLSYGMETGLFTLLSLLAFYAYSLNRLKTVSAISILVVFTRLDGVLVPGIIFSHFLFSQYAETRSFRAVLNSVIRLRFPALILAAGLGAGLVFTKFYFGHALPLSFLAKLLITDAISGGVTYRAVWDLLVPTVPNVTPMLIRVLFAATIVLGLFSLRRFREILRDPRILPLFWVFLHITVFVIKSAPPFPWYFMPAVFVSLAYIGIFTALSQRQSPVYLRFIQRILYAGCCLAAAASTASLVKNDNGGQSTFDTEERRIMAEAIRADRAKVDPTHSNRYGVMAFEVGYLGYILKPAAVHDLLGLVTPDVVFNPELRRDSLKKYLNWKPEYSVIVDANLYPPTSGVHQSQIFQTENDPLFILPRPFGHNYVVYKRRDIPSPVQEVKVVSRPTGEPNSLEFALPDKQTFRVDDLLCFTITTDQNLEVSLKFSKDQVWSGAAAHREFRFPAPKTYSVCARFYSDETIDGLRLTGNHPQDFEDIRFYRSHR